jgi:aspartyl/asparaginyl beta-hydroxylase (cupin superfamily)
VCPENKTGIKFNTIYNQYFTYKKEITKLTEIQEPWSKYSENSTTLISMESQKNVEQETK